ncbi:MAG: DUF6049 family protein [Marmoricola sp.]
MDHPCARPGTSFRRPAALLVLVLLSLSATLLPGFPARAADDDTAATPLTVRLVRMSPAVVPAKGNLVLEGTVTNSSEEIWRAVNVHPFMGFEPMTTRDELAAAAASDPATDVGERITTIGEFEAVGDLQPAQTAAFRIVLPAKDLPISHRAGVYWVGVHALAQSPNGGRGVQGRDRTFIPLVKGTSATTSVAVVVPIRAQVRRDTKGRLLGTSSWSDSLQPSGRLGRVADFVASAGPTPLTLLIDPAVLDAVSDLAQDNPPLSLGKPVEPGPGESPSSSDSPSRSGIREGAGDQDNARAWLTQVSTAARRHVALGLGYADPDIASLIRQGSPLYALANRLSAQTFKDLRIDAVPTVAPPSGWLEDDAIARLKEQTTVLVSDHAAPRTRTRWRAPEGQDLVFADQQVSSGGPGPTAPTDALALRQRILADAALRTTENADGPMVVELPHDWDPGSNWQSADFFASLDQPWLNLVALGPNTNADTPTFSAALGYPAAQHKLEVPVPNITAARTLAQTTTALSQLLVSENDVDHALAGIALNAVSVHARSDAVEARIEVLDTNAAMRTRIGKVEVLGTDFVTLSGGSGTLAVTLVNGLDQPVVVGVRPTTSTRDVSVAATKPVKMAPGERTVLRLKARASSIGVSRITLTPVTADGTELGTPLAFSLRTSQVGKTIWFVLIAFGALLVVMILRRVRRGLVEHRWKGRE